MGLLSLLYNDGETPVEKQGAVAPKAKESTLIKFPSTANDSPVESTFSFPKTETNPSFTPTSSSPPLTNGEVPMSYIEKALELYENGFATLNQPGFDFYEFFQSVAHGGLDNPTVYTMAFQMGCGMDKTITKDKLIEQGNFYLEKINEVYQGYVSQGSQKKNEILNEKGSEQTFLASELNSLEEQFEALKIQIEDRKSKLSDIDNKYSAKVSDINNKISANETANKKLVDSIQQILMGIKNNLK